MIKYIGSNSSPMSMQKFSVDAGAVQQKIQNTEVLLAKKLETQIRIDNETMNKEEVKNFKSTRSI